VPDNEDWFTLNVVAVAKLQTTLDAFNVFLFFTAPELTVMA
jgi:hypothetical protein